MERQQTPASARVSGKIRVLQLTATLAIGGSEQLAATIGRGLDRANFESLFAAVGPDGPIGQALHEEGFGTFAFDRPPGLTPRLLWRMRRFLREQRVDIVQTHHLQSLVYGGLPARLVGARLVHTEHDVQTFTQRPRLIRLLRWLGPLVHRFVAIDQHLADFLRDQVRLPAQRIEVIRNGVDLSRFQPAHCQPESTGRPFVVGWVGRLEPPKRPDVLVDALAQLAPALPELRVRMAGPGSLLEPMRQRASQAGIGDRLELLGPRDDVAQLLADMDCYVLCSDNEGLPIALVEAMATGLPCIASAVGGIGGLIRHEIDGLLLQPNDPSLLAGLLRRIHDDGPWRRQLGQSARATAAANYDLKGMIERYSAIFCELAGQRSR